MAVLNNLWLHIGLGKCAHRHLAYSLVRDKYVAATVADVMAKRSFPNLLASDGYVVHEKFSGVRWGEGEVNNTEEMAEVAKKCFPGASILLIVRRQDTYMESLYNQLVKRGETMEFDEWFKWLPIDNFQWHKIVETYERHFNNVQVIPMEREMLGQSLLSAVVSVTGLRTVAGASETTIHNPSLDKEYLPIVRASNAVLQGKARFEAADYLSKLHPKSPHESHDLMSTEKREVIMDYFEDSNKGLGIEWPR